MGNKGRSNDASRSRHIQRMSKEGKDPEIILKEMERIKDPYFRSLSFLAIARSNKISPKKKEDLLGHSIEESDGVPQEWRRAELLSLLMKGSRELDDESNNILQEMVLERLEAFPPGQGLSDALEGVSSYLEPGHWKKMLEISLNNSGFEKTNAKTLIRQIIKTGRWEQGYQIVQERASYLEDDELAVSLLSYLHHQVRKKAGEKTGSRALEYALARIKKLEEESSAKYFSILCMNNRSLKDLDLLERSTRDIQNTLPCLRSLSDLATASDKAGDRKKAFGYLDEAASMIDDLENDKDILEALALIASAMARLDEKERSLSLFERAIALTEGDPVSKKRLEDRMRKAGMVETLRKDSQSATDLPSSATRHVLALYDTYEGGLKQTHVRAVSRAAPLCAAFSLDLALMGFPSDDIERIVELSSVETNIGRGGRYLKELHREGRVFLVKCSQGGPPNDWKELGLPVATTSRPQKDKTVSMEKAKEIARREHGLGRVCLIMGIGRKGLPRSIIDSALYHLEITGSNIPLETATAMGILSFMLADGDK